MKNEKRSDQLGQRLRRITADLKLYIEKRLELMMVNTGEYLSGWMAASIHRAMGALLLMGGICFLLFALAIYLGNWLGSESLGYVLVSLPLLAAGLLFVYLKPKSVFDFVRDRFEAEVLKAINQNGEIDQKKIESSNTLRTENRQKDQ